MIMLHHSGRVTSQPSLDTAEAIMKVSAHVIQALGETKSPLLQLPHITEDMLRSVRLRCLPINSKQLHLISALRKSWV